MHAAWVRETTTTTGTGNLTIASVSGYPRFSDWFGSGTGAEQFAYAILNDADGTPIERGIGRLSDANTLVRERILATYLSGTLDKSAPAAASLGAGTKRVICAGDPATIMQAMPGVHNPSGVGRAVLPYSGSFSASTTATSSADRIILQPLQVQVASEIEAFKFEVTTAGAAGKLAKIGLYACGADGWAGKRIDQSGTIAVDSTGVKTWTLSTPLSLPAGWYYLAFTTDGTPTLRCYAVQSFFSPNPLGVGSAIDTVYQIAFKAIGTTLTLPDPMDAISGFTLAKYNASNYCPIILPVHSA